MTSLEELRRILTERILVLDGAMGTMLQKHALTEADFRGAVFDGWQRELRGNNECLNLTRPEVIREIHRSYIAAGADIIESNSFSANRISQAEYGCEDYARRMAFEAARIARESADGAGRKVWVAGSIGPTGKSLTLASDLSRPAYRSFGFDEMSEAYSEQIAALRDGGVDFLLAETNFDALNVKAAVYAAARVAPELPFIISVSVSDRSGRTLTGQTLEAFYTSVKHAPLLAFGLNCSFGAAELEPLLESLSTVVECPLCFYPNAGLPNEMGQYDETPQVMASSISRIASKGLLNIVGGCCGTTPEHIAAVAAAVKDAKPHVPVCVDRTLPRLSVSGLECATVDKAAGNFTNVGERTNVAGSRKFARLIASGAYEEALQIAADQIAGGASIIDINMDDAMLDSTVEMEKFLRYVSNDPSVAKAALMIDSSHFDTVLAGLKNCQGKSIVNSISLKEGEETFLEHAREIHMLGAAVVVMAFDELGQATDVHRKIEICRRAYDLLVGKAGFDPRDIIFDVNVLSVGTGIAEHARYGIDFIDAVRWIKTNLPGSLTSGGISNLSFAFRGNNVVREAMHSAFLYHAGAAGLDMGIVNPSMLQVYDDIDPELLGLVEDVILNRREDATEKLVDKAAEILARKETAAGKRPDTVPVVEVQLPVRERLAESLVKGGSGRLEADVMEALGELGSAVAVIEGPLMAGMEKVGKLFESGKMFLPQVVKSARTMRDAVDLLQPYMSATEGVDSTASRPKVVIATVRGDVHDIGKNITSIVLSCNGFDVTDLGVMVPEETILDEAERLGADIIAASGLITPSLSRMEDLCRKMSERGMTVPLFIGGATTSALHTAVKLAPLYGHVFYGSDASASAVMAKKYMMDPAAFEESEHAAQAKIRDLYNSRTDSRPGQDRVAFDDSSYLCGKVFSDIPYMELDIASLRPYFDWRMLCAVWGFKYADTVSEEPQRLVDDAAAVLDSMEKDGGCSIRIAARFLDSYAVGDDIHAETDGWEVLFPMLRQESAPGRCLSDFIVPGRLGTSSQLGMFAVSVHSRHHGAECDCGCHQTDGYEPMLERSVRLTLAEAASSWLDEKLRSELPQDRGDVRISKPAAGYSSCPDHSLKRDILELLDPESKLGISFTESYAMVPDASICGLIFAHPEAGYPEIHSASREAVHDYAFRRGMDEDQEKTFLSHLISL